MLVSTKSFEHLDLDRFEVFEFLHYPQCHRLHFAVTFFVFPFFVFDICFEFI